MANQKTSELYGVNIPSVNTTGWTLNGSSYYQFSSSNQSSSASLAAYNRYLFGYWLLNEESGTRYNSAGPGYDLLDSGGTSYVNDATFGKVADFDGDNDYLYIQSNDIIPWFGSCSLAFWAKTDATASNMVYYCNFGSGFVGWNNTGGSIGAEVYDGTHDVIVSAIGTYNDNAWHHIVVVRDYLVKLKVYIDGILNNEGNDTVTNALSIAYPTSLFKLGSRTPTAPANYFNGKMRQAILWKNCAISPEAVAALYNSGSGRLLVNSSSGEYLWQ